MGVLTVGLWQNFRTSATTFEPSTHRRILRQVVDMATGPAASTTAASYTGTVTYERPGTYTVSATAWDHQARSTMTAASITVTSAIFPGVVIPPCRNLATLVPDWRICPIHPSGAG